MPKTMTTTEVVAAYHEIVNLMIIQGWQELDVPGTTRTVVYHPNGHEFDTWTEAVRSCILVASA